VRGVGTVTVWRGWVWCVSRDAHAVLSFLSVRCFFLAPVVACAANRCGWGGQTRFGFFFFITLLVRLHFVRLCSLKGVMCRALSLSRVKSEEWWRKREDLHGKRKKEEGRGQTVEKKSEDAGEE